MTRERTVLRRLHTALRIGVDEVRATLKRPWRIVYLFSPGRLRRYLRFQRMRAETDLSWHRDSECDGLSSREVAHYKSYVELQGSKLDHIALAGHEIRFCAELSKRLKDLGIISPGMTALCLGARLGSEVRAFTDLGCFAVGIDLNPGKENRYVLHGDFHDLQIASRCVDVVYTNSIDHTPDLRRMVGEILRVLKPEGYVIIEADPGVEEEDEVQPDMWQMLSWRRTEDLTAALEGLRLKLLRSRPFEYPRGGTQLVFVLQDCADTGRRSHVDSGQ